MATRLAESPSKEKVYAFYHATFEEYFAALAVDDWHYFLSHVPENPQQGIYRIFEPQWKEVILLWLGREDVKKQQKQDFIKTLVEFEDACDDFYKYRAYFLAAAGIAEFSNCSLTDEIVIQLVTMYFGYFDSENQSHAEFAWPIEQEIYAALLHTNRLKVVQFIVNFIQNTENEYTHYKAAYILGEIGENNPVATNAIISLLKIYRGGDIAEAVYDTLHKIGKNNQELINTILDLIQNPLDEDISLVVSLLANLTNGNSQVITVLEKVIENTQDTEMFYYIAETLAKIEPSNSLIVTAIIKLINDPCDLALGDILEDLPPIIAHHKSELISKIVEVVENSNNEEIISNAICILNKISSSHPLIVTCCLDFIQKSSNRSLQMFGAETLGKIDKYYVLAAMKLIDLLQTEDDEFFIIWALEKISFNSYSSIIAANLMQVIQNCKNESKKINIVNNLIKMQPNSLIAIETLLKLMKTSSDEWVKWRAADSLLTLNKENTIAVTTLVELIQFSTNKSICLKAIETLGTKTNNNSIAVLALVKFIHNYEQKLDFGDKNPFDILIDILPVSEMDRVVNFFKYSLNDEIYKSDLQRFDSCFKLIWHCAQNMSYADFYHAWHDDSFLLQNLET
ncbi:hypothetical protein PQG02_16320 [Nostoc sp. UHCC 0926]|uniref:hypothetical protein n=1 Tax=unclassified Nostoc TaxID=2593658 RepID=UPI00235DEB4A|nr:hypothetical protein [Nostoc sp. UHCC 0926]WDD30345.1 hypothetical protein PQG02_16320 [Nostoc sp. UHCC 0926]